MSGTAKKNRKKTRMHSIRMRTGRSLTVCWSLLPGGVSAPWGSALGGCLLRVCVCVCVCLLGRVSAPGGVGIPACTEADPPMNRMTNTSKNITLPTTSLRLVKTKIGLGNCGIPI